MKYLLPLATVGLALALAAPVAAQPLDITVRGGVPAEIPYIIPGWDDYVYGPTFFQNDYFQPDSAAINALNAMHIQDERGVRAINISIARTLGASRGSWTRHQEACQAAFASYDMISDTYLVGGLPRRCPF